MKKRLRSRHQIIKALFLLGIFVSFLSKPGNAQVTGDGITTIILVRHAEKVDNSSDPDLSEDGYERAAKLAEILQHVKFDAVYSTDFIRTRETAKPVAEANNLSIIPYDPGNSASEARKWLSNHSGETILVSGHSNSTPAFANEILGRQHFESGFDESDYGNLLMISISDNGERKLLHLRY